jgi:hypothetical protein
MTIARATVVTTGWDTMPEPTLPYKGYVLRADPARRRDAFVARVVIELHAGQAVHYQEVCGDPFVRYATRDRAARASLDFGRELLDSRPPAPVHR